MNDTPKPPDDDAGLMLSFQNGDDSSFEKLVDKYKKNVTSLTYRFTGSRNAAEDLGQEVFLRIFRAKQNYRPRSRFSTWLYRIAANVSIDYLRRNSRNAAKMVSLDRPAGDTGEEYIRNSNAAADLPADKIIEQNARQKLIENAFYSLPDTQRIAFSLCIYEEKSYKEISEILGCSVSSVESIIFRARQALKRQLSGI